MVDEKNNVAFHTSEQLKSFQSLQEKQKILLNFGLVIPDPSLLHKVLYFLFNMKR